MAADPERQVLEGTVRGKTINDVLNMSVEEGERSSQVSPRWRGRKIEVLDNLGLG